MQKIDSMIWRIANADNKIRLVYDLSGDDYAETTSDPRNEIHPFCSDGISAHVDESLIEIAVSCHVLSAAAPGADHDGDVNIDGDVNVVDLLWGQQALQGTRSLLPEQEAHGDVAPLVSDVPQPDGVFDLGNVLVIQRMVLGALDFSVPGNQFNIGDSIGEGEAADGTIGQAHHETVWSTGYDGGDSVNSFNERFSSVSRLDPDTVYPGDGGDCQRRKQLHAIIRDDYNPILRGVLDEYRQSGRLPNARYTDIYDVRFDSQHVNDGDCFHPSTTGHALLAQSEWCRTHWGNGDPACTNWTMPAGRERNSTIAAGTANRCPSSSARTR
jgi:hypothetical protein